MNLTDLHCDTLLCARNTAVSLIPRTNGMQISLENASEYENYTQVLGIFSDPDYSDEEAYARFLECVGYVKADSLHYPSNFKYVLAVEGANLLNGNISRMDILYSRGVKFLTLVWGEYTCIGGAHNDGRGYTEFGKNVVRRCFELGITPDVSHSSDKLFWETAEIADSFGKPIVATHSNSRTVCSHNRCLTDDMFRYIVKCGGLAGISMVRGHLKLNGFDSECGISHIADHIEHYMSLGGENSIALGTDLDGTSPLPDGISGVADLYKIADYLAKINYTQSQIDKIFNTNAQNFMKKQGILL